MWIADDDGYLVDKNGRHIARIDSSVRGHIDLQGMSEANFRVMLAAVDQLLGEVCAAAVCEPHCGCPRGAAARDNECHYCGNYPHEIGCPIS